MKYRKKPIVIEAHRWFKNGDHPQVKDRQPKIIFDERGHYFYVSHCDADLPSPNTWLAVDPIGTVAKQNGESLPFAFYKLKSDHTKDCRAWDWPGMYERYVKNQGWSKYPAKNLGYINTLEGGHIVTPGDWIICGVKGEFYPCKPDIFAVTYEPV